GSFLLMPTSMPHAGIEESKRVLAQLDMAVTNIPEVEISVGKLGRAESAIDPAPISMYENIINYKPEYSVSEDGELQTFKVDDQGRFILRSGEHLNNEQFLNQHISHEQLIPDQDGAYFRNWREHIQSPDDIWDEIVKATHIPGV